MANYILSYFPNTDLRNSHEGLTGIALEAKKRVDKLKPGEFLLFINRRQNALKMITNDGVLVHIKAPHGRLNFNAVNLLPQHFNGTKFNYRGALKEALLKQLKGKHKE